MTTKKTTAKKPAPQHVSAEETIAPLQQSLAPSVDAAPAVADDRRTLIAAAVATGMAAAGMHGVREGNYDSFAGQVVSATDSIIARLDKQPDVDAPTEE